MQTILLLANGSPFLIGGGPAQLGSDVPVGDLVAQEFFGVAHPDQLLTYDKPTAVDPSTHRLLEGASEVAYQVEGSNVLVRADSGLNANSTRTWSWASGAASITDQVSVTDPGGTYLLMDNGIISVRIAKPITVFSDAHIWGPGNESFYVQHTGTLPDIPIPIQGVKHVDGTWTATDGTKFITSYYQTTTEGQTWLPFPAISMTTTILENGPLRAVVQVEYIGPLVAILYPSTNYPSDDNGYFRSTITLEAGQSSFIVKDETNHNIKYSFNMNVGVSADVYRYRGHGASAAIYGHKADGTTVYPASDSRIPDYDAEALLATTSQHVILTGPPSGYPPLYVWYTWGTNGGYYYHCANKTAASTANVFGIFQGPSSEIDGPNNLVGLYTETGEHGVDCAYAPGIDARDGTTYRLHTFKYGVYLGTKADDFPDDFTVEPAIAKAMNLYSGTAQLHKMIDLGLDFPTPSGGWDGLYLPYSSLSAKIIAIRDDPQGTGGTGPYARAWNQDPTYRNLWTVFRDATLAQATTLVNNIVSSMATQLNAYINTDSIYFIPYQYIQGANYFYNYGIQINALLVLDRITPYLTTTQVTTLKGLLSIIGHILWDDDFVPLGNYQWFTLGTANMPVQEGGYRKFITTLLKDHPQFIARFSDVVSQVQAQFNNYVNAYGAPLSCPHYAGTAMPTMDVIRQLQVVGVADLFATGSAIKARMELFGEYYMQVLSPPQSRFGGVRKMVVYGDGGPQGHDNHLTMIMGFQSSNPTLAARMMNSWVSMGKPLISFYGSSTLKIDETVTNTDMALGDYDLQGYMTVMRSAWGTSDESAVFVCHGDWFTDHAGAQRGSAQLYLLGAPVSVMFGSIYTPHSNGAWLGNTYIPVSAFATAWDAVTNIQMDCGTYSQYHHENSYTYTTTTDKVSLVCNFQVDSWTRKVDYYRDDTAMPVVRIRDSNSASGDAVFSLNMMAGGAVTKPDDSTVTPSTSSLTATPYSISNGARWKFIGLWGTSWDVYYFGPTGQAYVGEWHYTSTETAELVEYAAANSGATFIESQYLLKIKTAGPCDVVVVPYPTGSRPSDLSVTQITGGVRLTANSATRDLMD